MGHWTSNCLLFLVTSKPYNRVSDTGLYVVAYPENIYRLIVTIVTVYCMNFIIFIRDVVLGLGPWSLVVLKDKIAVLGPGLGLEPSVLGPVLGLAC